MTGLCSATLNSRNTVNVGVVSISLTLAAKPVLFIEHQAICFDTLLIGLALPVQHFRDIACGKFQAAFPPQQVDNFICNGHLSFFERATAATSTLVGLPMQHARRPNQTSRAKRAKSSNIAATRSRSRQDRDDGCPQPI